MKHILKINHFIDYAFESSNMFQELSEPYHLRWEINEGFNISSFFRTQVLLGFQPCCDELSFFNEKCFKFTFYYIGSNIH